MCIKPTSWRRRWYRGDTFPLIFIDSVRGERGKGRGRRRRGGREIITGEEKGKD